MLSIYSAYSSMIHRHLQYNRIFSDVSPSKHQLHCFAAMAVAAKQQMLGHIAHILKPGSRWGVLDFLALAEAKRYQCFVYIGDEVTDLRQRFGQSLDPFHRFEPVGVCHVVGCFTHGGVSLGLGVHAHGTPNVNHWIVAERSRLAGTIRMCPVAASLASAGLIPVQIIERDCGPAVWAHALGLPRNGKALHSLRMDLARFFLEHIDDPVWHNIWWTLGWSSVSPDVCESSRGGGGVNHDNGSGKSGSGGGRCGSATSGARVGKGFPGRGQAKASAAANAKAKAKASTAAKSKASAKALCFRKGGKGNK